MGNKSTTTQYFVNSDHINTNQSQTDTTHIPVDVTTSVNPGKFEGTTEDLKLLYNYISTISEANDNSPLDGLYDFKNFANLYVDTFLYDEIQNVKLDDELTQDMKDLELQLLERGIMSTFFSTAKDMLSGKISVSQNFVKMINSATSRITAVSRSTLGEGITNRLLNGMRLSAPVLKTFLDETFNGLLVPHHEKFDDETPLPGAVETTAIKNSGLLRSGANNWLPPSSTQGPKGLEFVRASLLRRGENTQNFRVAYAAFQDILTGNKKVNLNSTLNTRGEQCYECPAAALMSEQHMIPIITGAEVISKIVPAMIMAELATVTAKANIAACTGSSPGIANTPNQVEIQEIADMIPIEYQLAAAESIRQDGARYGLQILDSSDPSNEAVPDSDVMQMLLDRTPLNTKEGTNVRSVRLMKEAYQRIFPEGVHVIESLIASPQNISLRDVPVPLAADIPWSDPIEAFANNMGGGIWVDTLPVNDPKHYSGKPWVSTGINSVNMASGLTVFDKYPYSGQFFKNLITNNDVNCACGLGCNFNIKEIYQSYNIIFQLTLSYWELVDTKGKAQPGIFFISDSTITNGKPSAAIFIPAIQQGNSMLYTISIASENCTDAIGNNLFGSSGIFTVGVGWDFGKKGPLIADFPKLIDDSYAFAVSIIGGTATISRNGQSPTLGYWVKNGEGTMEPFLSSIFSVTMIDEITSHPADVSHFWKETIAPLFTPYLRSIVGLVKDQANRLAIAGLSVRLRKAAIDKTNFDSYEKITDWLVAVISEFNSWMLWRGLSPWVKIKPESVPKISWCVICLMRAFVMMTVYLEPNSSTITSAMTNLSNMFNDTNNSLLDYHEGKLSQSAMKTYQVNALRLDAHSKTEMLKLLNTID